MFIGEYKHNLDAKGRLAIPAKFRAQLEGGAVVTKGLDNCLVLYPKQEWETLAKKLAALPISKTNSRAFARMILAGAMEVEFDSQGRIVLPAYLRTFATLNKAAVVAGLFDRLEIWDESLWEAYKASTEAKSSDIAEAMGELEI
ncbi:division/cell wall cluster transcriptional repressor MraZ [Candidatus Falkowbacteria bacterium]|nr:division/cell wall cluster transcriptional repressor MraZ [Candidatus Falkowbacteria bacterium]